jgi:hypothetical protein
MWRTSWIAWMAVVAIGVAGCGGSDETPGGGGEGGNARAEQAGPAAAVYDFLEAVRTGDDETARIMLTPLARRRTAERDMQVAPEGSDTAEFEIGQIEYLAEDGARVATTWSDLDGNLQRRTDQITWMLRRGSEGWRIAGAAATVFPGEPPLLLDFEDPDEMLRKQELVQQEISRRARQEALQAMDGQVPQDSVRR